jgi:hypothetical protein
VGVVVAGGDDVSVTTNEVRSVPALAQATWIGQRPGVVLEPTDQLQLTRPEMARFGDRPAAREGPDAYVTVIEHRTEAGETLAVSVELLPLAIGEVRRTRRTAAPADDVNSSAVALAATKTRARVMRPPSRRAYHCTVRPTRLRTRPQER